MPNKFASLSRAIRHCQICAAQLPGGPHPVFQASPQARILVAAQAPGLLVHETGIPFNDASGERLRRWMGVDRETFYDASQIALVPMGFCYPGRGLSGDLPPLPICAERWRKPLLSHLTNISLTLVIGQYALAWHLPEHKHNGLTATVRNWPAFWPDILPMPHPSPRNNIWLKRNPWFEEEVVPMLQNRVKHLLQSNS